PESTDLFANELSHFQKEMGNFRVVKHATVPLDNPNSGDARIYMILPDMHMWASPEELRKRRKEFFDEEELKVLDRSIKDGKVLRNKDGSLDIPVEKGESTDEHALRMLTTPEGRVAMKENAFSNTQKMSEQEEKNAFGSTARSDLVKLLDALHRA